MILGHVMGLPVEETVLQFASAGAAITAGLVAGRTTFGRILGRIRRR